MKTSKKTNEMYVLATKTVMSVALISTLILSMAFSGLNNSIPLELYSESNEGAFIASKFNELKKENRISDEVLLKIFVKYTKVKQYQ